MILRQFFDAASSTYTYLIASGTGGEALIIDPVKEHCRDLRDAAAPARRASIARSTPTPTPITSRRSAICAKQPGA